MTSNLAQKFDKIEEKLQSIEDAVSKMSILSNNPSNAAPESAKRFMLKKEFKDLKELDNFDDFISGEDVEYFNVKWYMGLVRSNKHLIFHIGCERKQDNMSIETELKIKLIGYKNMIKIMKHCFPHNDDYLELEIIDDELRTLNNLTLEVEVEILSMTGIERKKLRTFDESQKDVSDVVLMVQGTPFYVLKMVKIHSKRKILKELEKEFSTKLQLSSKYRLEELKAQCLSKINTVENVRELLPHDLIDLDPSVALEILRKCVSATKS
ncbi:hypothetical protein B9Z55_028416 [Caenorhabditis nigoni]|nr:hypothetical protein B9Z55_028416 [Caenorhabditis nigoni]